jgi:hypothetical protein
MPRLGHVINRVLQLGKENERARGMIMVRRLRIVELN